MKRIYSVTKAYHSTKQKGLKKFESRTTTAAIDSGVGDHVHGWGLYLQVNKLQNRRDYYYGAMADDFNYIPDDVENAPKSNIAVQYTVEIPDDMMFLDEFGHTPEWLAEKMCMLGSYDPYTKTVERWWEDADDETRRRMINRYANEMQFKTFYAELCKILGSDEKASLWLAENGIDGIRYNGDDDGDCFVIYNCDKLKIVAEY